MACLEAAENILYCFLYMLRGSIQILQDTHVKLGFLWGGLRGERGPREAATGLLPFSRGMTPRPGRSTGGPAPAVLGVVVHFCTSLVHFTRARPDASSEVIAGQACVHRPATNHHNGPPNHTGRVGKGPCGS